MHAESWSAIAALGSLITALVAFFTSFIALHSLRLQRRSTDLESALKVMDVIMKKGAEVRHARESKSESWTTDFESWMNYLEVFADLLNRNSYPPVTKSLIQTLLTQYLEVVDGDPDLREALVAARVDMDTFKSLRKLVRAEEIRMPWLHEHFST